MVEGVGTVDDALMHVPAVDERHWQKVIDVQALSQAFLNPHGQPLPTNSLNPEDALRFVGSRGGVSRTSASARPGEMFRAIALIRVEGQGDVVPAHFGPIFLGPRDEILAYSSVIADLALDTDCPVDLEMPAPVGTVAVRLRMVGGWADGRDSRLLVYRYRVARLYRRRADV